VEEQVGKPDRMPGDHASCRDASRYPHGVLELVARYAVLVRDHVEGLASAEHRQRVFQTCTPAREHRLPKPRRGSTRTSATPYAGSRINRA
jgi:hypothetical protein